jgi:hypothetical protein
MHAYTIAVTMAMAGSSMAAVLQSPPATSTTTVIMDEIRPYGPTCAGVGPGGHDGPICAGVGPAAPTPPAAEKKEDDKFVPFTPEDAGDLKGIVGIFDADHDGDFDHQDLQRIKEMDRESEEPELDEPELEELELEEPELEEPEHVKPELPKHIAPPVVHVASKTCPECPKCSKCPDPSEHNPKWDQLALLNDTRKNINGFKLFAELNTPPSAEFPPRFAVHVVEHDQRKDIWNVKMFPEVMAGMIEVSEQIGMNLTKLKKTATPQQKAFLDEMEAFNSYQPRWNLADNRLETRSNTSAPVNDTLYFRLFETEPDAKDTSQYRGPVYRSVLTTNSNKNKYQAEGNAKLIGKKSWQLKRDNDAPWHYTLLNKDMQGNFFWCIPQGKMSAMEAKLKDVGSSEQQDGRDVIQALEVLGDHQGAELKFMNSTEAAVPLDSGNTTCRAVTLKVC